MDTITINGLHKCQPKNIPDVGEVKNMVVLNMPAKGDKKAWISIKNKKPEDGGTPYRILNVQPLDWPPDQYGNVAMNLEVEASNSQPSAFSKARETMQQGDEHGVVEREESGGGSTFGRDRDWPEAPPITPEPPPKRFSMLDERQRAIIRQHSQSMALEVLKLKVALEQLTVEDLTPSKLKSLADYFDNDVIGAASNE